MIFCVTSLFADLEILGGKVVNASIGPLGFDLTNDGNVDITMSSNGMLGIGTSDPKSSMEVAGSVGFNLETFTASTGTISGNSIVLADTASGNITLTLPVASTVTGRLYQIKKISDNYQLSITAAANIDNYNSAIVLSTSASGFPYVNVVSSGTQWLITSRSPD
jgi:hypothetical protein